MKPGAQSLEDILDRETELARRLAGVLAAERTALTGRSSNEVLARGNEKRAVLESLEALEAQRRDLCAALGVALPPGSGSENGTPNEAVALRWRNLMMLTAECRTANEVNGKIIHVRQGQIRQLLDIVRGGSPVTYGPKGKTLASAHRALARA
jgi:flagellar biosynthesis/type III secretory pathway chaperone